MNGSKLTEGLQSLSKSLQQAQWRALKTFKFPRRWPSREEIGAVLAEAAAVEARMERVEKSAAVHFILSNAGDAF